MELEEENCWQCYIKFLLIYIKICYAMRLETVDWRRVKLISNWISAILNGESTAELKVFYLMKFNCISLKSPEIQAASNIYAR